jgi:hypothetical protein
MTKNLLLSAASAVAVSLAVLPLVFGSPAIASAKAQHQPAGHAAGTVKGVLELFGGPYPGRAYPRPGTVTAHHKGKKETITVTVRTNKHGRYTLNLPPGRYTLTGKPRHEHLQCRAEHPVVVQSNQTTIHVKVICPVP